MRSFDLAVDLLALFGTATALAIVACWPSVRGKSWLVVALSLWVGIAIWGNSLSIYRHFYGNESRVLWRYVRPVHQIIELGISAALLMAVLQLKESLRNQAASALSRVLDWLQATPVLAALLILLGMSSPWVHYQRRWISAWSSSAEILGVVFPGFLLAVAAIVAVVWSSRGNHRRHRGLPLALCGYGIAHSLFMGWGLINTPVVNVGFGLVLSQLGFVALAFSLVHPATRHQAAQPESAQSVAAGTLGQD